MDSIFRRLPENPSDAERGYLKCDAQTVSFYSELSQYIVEHLPVGWHNYSLLDIGPRTGSGLALLRLMHHPESFARIKLDPVTGIDINPTFAEMARERYPDIEVLTGDAFDVQGRKWDLVISCAVIEHVENPPEFLRKMVSLANKAAIIACPFFEENLIKCHISRITYKMLTDAGFSSMKVYRASHWHNSLYVIASRGLR